MNQTDKSKLHLSQSAVKTPTSLKIRQTSSFSPLTFLLPPPSPRIMQQSHHLLSLLPHHPRASEHPRPVLTAVRAAAARRHLSKRPHHRLLHEAGAGDVVGAGGRGLAEEARERGRRRRERRLGFWRERERPPARAPPARAPPSGLPATDGSLSGSLSWEVSTLGEGGEEGREVPVAG